MNNNVNRYEESSNIAIISAFINVFHSEIIPTLHQEEALSANLINSIDKKEYLRNIFDKSNFLLLGYNNKPIQIAVDDYEFYLYILSYFNRYGKLYIEQHFIDNKYTLIISISFFNNHKNSIEVFRYDYSEVYQEYLQNIHLYFLIAIKSIVFNILIDLINLDLDIEQIKTHYSEFIKKVENNDNSAEREN